MASSSQMGTQKPLPVPEMALGAALRFSVLCRSRRRLSSSRHDRQAENGSHPAPRGSPPSGRGCLSQQIDPFSRINRRFPGRPITAAGLLRAPDAPDPPDRNGPPFPQNPVPSSFHPDGCETRRTRFCFPPAAHKPSPQPAHSRPSDKTAHIQPPAALPLHPEFQQPHPDTFCNIP